MIRNTKEGVCAVHWLWTRPRMTLLEEYSDIVVNNLTLYLLKLIRSTIQMGVGGRRKATVRSTSNKPRHALTKKEKVMKRSARINRIVQMKKRAKILRKSKITPYKKRLQTAAENELVEAQEPVFNDTATNEEMNILRLLNLVPIDQSVTNNPAYM
jgi:hypothetical protein